MNTSLSNGVTLNVKVGDKDLISSGIIHLEQSEFEITINTLVIRFCFIDDDGQSRFAGRIEESVLIVELYNHNNSLGEGVFAPLELGTLGNRKLYATYYVSTVQKEEKKRRFEFALYLGDKV